MSGSPAGGSFAGGSLVGVVGARSLVGQCLLPRLKHAGWQVQAYSRQPCQAGQAGPGIAWRQLSTDSASVTPVTERIADWIFAAPIWLLPDYFSWLEAAGVRRLVALSSTSRFTKIDSGDKSEMAVAARLIDAEKSLQCWAESQGITWVILRPTLIYGFGRDKNIAEMVRFIRRFHFFPVLGKAAGLRQPIHADDVAQACVAALQASAAANRAYNISGGETLPYRAMVNRVFVALGQSPRVVTVPRWVFGLAVALLRCLPRYRHWSAAMAERMNRDLVFDHGDAGRELGFKPRPFLLQSTDVAS